MSGHSNVNAGSADAFGTYPALLQQDIRELLEEGIDEENSQWIRSIVDELCVSLQTQFAAEEKCGYLTEVLDRFPNWHRRIEAMQDKRRVLIAQLNDLRSRLGRLSAGFTVAGQLRTDFEDWMFRLAAHKREENALMLDSVNLDVGEGE